MTNLPKSSPKTPEVEAAISSKIEPARKGAKPRRELTLKQRAFVKHYLKNKGNGTKTAKETYSCTTDNAAALISSENIRKPHIREAILKALNVAGLTPEYAISILKGQIHDDNPDLRHYLHMYFELSDAYPTKQISPENQSITINTQVIIANQVREALNKGPLQALEGLKETRSEPEPPLTPTDTKIEAID